MSTRAGLAGLLASVCAVKPTRRGLSLWRYDRTALWEKADMDGCDHMDGLEKKCTRYKPGISRATTNM